MTPVLETMADGQHRPLDRVYPGCSWHCPARQRTRTTLSGRSVARSTRRSRTRRPCMVPVDRGHPAGSVLCASRGRRWPRRCSPSLATAGKARRRAVDLCWRRARRAEVRRLPIGDSALSPLLGGVNSCEGVRSGVVVGAVVREVRRHDRSMLSRSVAPGVSMVRLPCSPRSSRLSPWGCVGFGLACDGVELKEGWRPR